ncbi:hypothetical protein Hamer_G032042 [Homarus americanus]|uniref:Uncharacterized protein n=1 Tax=Homarus americanus TaxID=6706 RepID=A0A8J5MPV7_HOMAM|nr:hypothetical protein Hamer_G032042 [Homarus americanus]
MLETTHKEWQVKEEGRKPTTINWKLAMRMGQDTNFPGIEKRLYPRVSCGGKFPLISGEVPTVFPVENRSSRDLTQEIKFPLSPFGEQVLTISCGDQVPTISCGDQVPTVSCGEQVPTNSDEGSKFPRSPLESKFPQTPMREFPVSCGAKFTSPVEAVPTVSCGSKFPDLLWRSSSPISPGDQVPTVSVESNFLQEAQWGFLAPVEASSHCPPVEASSPKLR